MTTATKKSKLRSECNRKMAVSTSHKANQSRLQLLRALYSLRRQAAARLSQTISTRFGRWIRQLAATAAIIKARKMAAATILMTKAASTSHKAKKIKMVAAASRKTKKIKRRLKRTTSLNLRSENHRKIVASALHKRKKIERLSKRT